MTVAAISRPAGVDHRGVLADPRSDEHSRILNLVLLEEATQSLDRKLAHRKAAEILLGHRGDQPGDAIATG